MDAIRAVRNRRSEMNVPPSRKARLLLVTEKPDLFAHAEPFLKKLAWASEVEIGAQPPADLDGMGRDCFFTLTAALTAALRLGGRCAAELASAS